MTTLPTLFLSHGSPELPQTRRLAREWIVELAARLPEPRAILVVSAHWVARPVGITAAATPGVIHDFYGFPPSLYELQYPAPGDPALARRVHVLLSEAGIPAREHPTRGLDHGVWSPLSLLYPEAHIPVVQLSLPKSDLSGALAMGRALRPLRAEGVLLIGSGGSVHNLHAVGMPGENEPWAYAFADWLKLAVEEGGVDWMMQRNHWPESMTLAHPTLEHLAPLLVAWGAAAEGARGACVIDGFDLGNLGMHAYLFPE